MNNQTEGIALCHIVDLNDWERSGPLWKPESYESDGFIHCSYRHQVAGTLQRYFAGVPNIAIVEFDPFRTEALIRAEPGTAGETNADGTPELFPHLYGPLPKESVSAVRGKEDFLPYRRRHGEYTITDERGALSVTAAAHYLGYESYWAQGRSREVVEASFSTSWILTVETENHEMAGMARLVTDWATVYYICDLFILAPHRGKGLGKALVDAIVTHPVLSTLHGMLKTADAHGLYERYGFQREDTPLESRRFMYRQRTEPTEGD